MAGLFVGMTSRPLRLSLSTWLSGYRPEDASEDVGYQLVRVCSGSDALAPSTRRSLRTSARARRGRTRGWSGIGCLAPFCAGGAAARSHAPPHRLRHVLDGQPVCEDGHAAALPGIDLVAKRLPLRGPFHGRGLPARGTGSPTMVCGSFTSESSCTAAVTRRSWTRSQSGMCCPVPWPGRCCCMLANNTAAAASIHSGWLACSRAWSWWRCACRRLRVSTFPWMPSGTWSLSSGFPAHNFEPMAESLRTRVWTARRIWALPA